MSVRRDVVPSMAAVASSLDAIGTFPDGIAGSMLLDFALVYSPISRVWASFTCECLSSQSMRLAYFH